MRYKKCINSILLTLAGLFLIGLALQFSTTRQMTIRKMSSDLLKTVQETMENSANYSIQRLIPEMVRDIEQSLSKQDTKSPSKYHLLINSYMNSGSRFTGQLFGFRTGAFYLYEPLWRFSIWDYYHEPNQVCSSLRGAAKCSTRTADQVNTVFIKGLRGNRLKLLQNTRGNESVTEMMTSVLQHAYNCSFIPIQNLLVPGVQDSSEFAEIEVQQERAFDDPPFNDIYMAIVVRKRTFGTFQKVEIMTNNCVYDAVVGQGWTEYRTCIKAKKPKLDCLKQLEARCRRASHVVTKVLRLTTGSMKSLLRKIPNLKVIQLFRDPRAIVNSRLESRGYPTNDVTMNAAALCNKMKLDYSGGHELMKEFPGRFKFIFYDDIKVDIEAKYKDLYKFIGMDFDLTEFRSFNKVKTNTANSRTPTLLANRASNNANWWRAHISFPRYQSIMDQCKMVIDVFNLTKFKDRNELKQSTISALNLPDGLKVNVS